MKNNYKDKSMPKTDRKMINEGRELIRKGLQILQGNAVEASKSLRSDLAELINDLQPAELTQELIEEIRQLQVALTNILPAKRVAEKRAPKKSTAEKILWIEKELESKNGAMQKADLVRSYSIAFGCKPSPMILDAAIANDQFQSVRAGRSVQVMLARILQERKGVTTNAN